VRRTLLIMTIAVFSAAPMFGAAQPKSWTVMVYMAADNDLEPFALDNLRQMLAAGAGPRVNLVILADRGANFSTQGVGNLPGWKGARLLSGGAGSLTPLADWGDADMGDPSTLSRFISWTLAQYPARHAALFFWDHGGGWSGFGVDDSHSSRLTPDELEKGITEGLAAARSPGLDLVGFDACLMADFETMVRLQGRAAYYLGSEELEPGHGWDYGSLSLLAADPDAGPLELGRAIIAGYMAKAARENTQGQATLSLVDLSRFPRLVKAIDRFTAAARKGIGRIAPDLGRGADAALAFGKAGSSAQDSHMVDIGCLMKAISSRNPYLAEECGAVNAALASCVVAREAGKLVKDSTGISIYFPNRKKLYSAEYGKWGHAGWSGLLSSYYTAGTGASAAVIPKFLARDNVGEMQADEDGLFLTGTLAPRCAGNIVDAWFAYGLVEDELTVLLGDAPAFVSEEDGTVEGFWDGTILTLTQGKRETYGYLSVSDTDGGQVLYSVPFAYFADGRVGSDDYQYAYMDVTTDENDEVLSSILYVESDDGMTGELSPRKGSALVPLVEVVGEDGESGMEMTEDWGFNATDWRSIELDCEEIETGSEVYLELNACNANDDGDWLYAQGMFGE
jgi:hypothetical protein